MDEKNKESSEQLLCVNGHGVFKGNLNEGYFCVECGKPQLRPSLPSVNAVKSVAQECPKCKSNISNSGYDWFCEQCDWRSSEYPYL